MFSAGQIASLWGGHSSFVASWSAAIDADFADGSGLHAKSFKESESVCSIEVGDALLEEFGEQGIAGGFSDIEPGVAAAAVGVAEAEPALVGFGEDENADVGVDIQDEVAAHERLSNMHICSRFAVPKATAARGIRLDAPAGLGQSVAQPRSGLSQNELSALGAVGSSVLHAGPPSRGRKLRAAVKQN